MEGLLYKSQVIQGTPSPAENYEEHMLIFFINLHRIFEILFVLTLLPQAHDAGVRWTSHNSGGGEGREEGRAGHYYLSQGSNIPASNHRRQLRGVLSNEDDTLRLSLPLPD